MDIIPSAVECTHARSEFTAALGHLADVCKDTEVIGAAIAQLPPQAPAGEFLCTPCSLMRSTMVAHQPMEWTPHTAWAMALT